MGAAARGEGREGPALLQPLLLPRPRGREALGPLGTATGSFGGDTRAKRMCLHPCLSGQWCGALSSSPSPLEACPVQERVPIALVPELPSPAASEPSGARSSAKMARAGGWGARNALPSQLRAGRRCWGRGQPRGAELCLPLGQALAGAHSDGAKCRAGTRLGQCPRCALPQVETAPSKHVRKQTVNPGCCSSLVFPFSALKADRAQGSPCTEQEVFTMILLGQ